VNGKVVGFFNCMREVRWGDYFSPLNCCIFEKPSAVEGLPTLWNRVILLLSVVCDCVLLRFLLE
jgi:hypothetical protein